MSQAANPTGVIAGKASGGSFKYKSSNSVFVTTVDSRAGIQNSGTGGDVVLVSTGGGIGQDQPISTSPVAGGDGFGVSLTAAGGSDVSLSNVSNNFSKVAASSGSGSITIVNGADLAVGTVDSKQGVSTSGNYVSIQVPASHTLSVIDPIYVGEGSTAVIKLAGGTIDLSGYGDPFLGWQVVQGDAVTYKTASAVALNADQISFGSVGLRAESEIAIAPFTSGNGIDVGAGVAREAEIAAAVRALDAKDIATVGSLPHARVFSALLKAAGDVAAARGLLAEENKTVDRVK